MPYSIEQRDSQMRNSRAAIRYHLHFTAAAQHLVRVVMEIDAVVTGERVVRLTLPTWLPGSYKIRDFSSNIGDFRAERRDGRDLHHEWLSKNQVQVSGIDGAFRVTYAYFALERTVQHSHVTRWHAFINPGTCCFAVDGRHDEVHHLILHHEAETDWKTVSTALSPVAGDGRVFGARNYDILVDSPLEIGNHFTTHFTNRGIRHDVAISAAGDVDCEWIAAQLPPIVAHGDRLFGGLPYDRYVFLIQLYPRLYGGLEHARCHVALFDSEALIDKKQTGRFLSLITHEFFHLWNVKRIRPAELGPFDYTRERYTGMLWLAEGATSYYDDLTSYRCGFFTQQEYLKVLSEQHLQALFEVPGRRRASVNESSFLTWVKLYQPNADLNNRYVSYYLKGGVLWWLVDLHVLAETGGRKRLDDGMRGLMARYRDNPAEGITEEEMNTILHDATGVDVHLLLRTWLRATAELPVAEFLAPFGLTLEPKRSTEPNTFGEKHPWQSEPMEWTTGLVAKEEGGVVRVARVLSEGPAEEAGLGADDEILAVNGMRITSLKQWEYLTTSARLQRTARIHAVSDGRVYETTMRFGPAVRKMLVVGKQTPQQKKLFAKWLER